MHLGKKKVGGRKLPKGDEPSATQYPGFFVGSIPRTKRLGPPGMHLASKVGQIGVRPPTRDKDEFLIVDVPDDFSEKIVKKDMRELDALGKGIAALYAGAIKPEPIPAKYAGWDFSFDDVQYMGQP